jgi:hypothetical protein
MAPVPHDGAGPVEVGVGWVGEDRAWLEISAPALEHAARVKLAEGEQTTVGGITVRLVRTDTGDHEGAWLIVTGTPKPTPS